jgi:hypothetical protein
MALSRLRLCASGGSRPPERERRSARSGTLVAGDIVSLEDANNRLKMIFTWSTTRSAIYWAKTLAAATYGTDVALEWMRLIVEFKLSQLTTCTNQC